jgi:hypothetical protein
MTRLEDDLHQDEPSSRKRLGLPRSVWIALCTGLAVVTVLAVLTLTVFIPQSVTSAGNQQEATLNSWYNQAVTALHNCTIKTARAAKVIGTQTEAVDKVLKDAVAGRYGTQGNNLDQGKMFSALKEAYPDGALAGLNKSFQDVLAVMLGCQDDFTSSQNQVQKRIATFDAWRTGSWRARSFGGGKFPNNNLRVNIAGVPQVSGQAAFDLMSRPIIDSDTSSAVNNGVDNSGKTNPFATATPTN